MSKKQRLAQESNSSKWPAYCSRLKRGPAVILPKDAGMIVQLSGIGKESKVLDAGAGSGWLAAQLARIAKEVISYEAREEFARIAQSNLRKLEFSNAQVRLRDVLKDGFDETDADLVCLDMANSDQVIPHAFAALKEGGVLVGYLPHAEQLKAFVLAGQSAGFGDWYCIESNLREMLVREAGVRPANIGLTHTGYLAFGRKKTKGSP